MLGRRASVPRRCTVGSVPGSVYPPVLSCYPPVIRSNVTFSQNGQKCHFCCFFKTVKSVISAVFCKTVKTVESSVGPRIVTFEQKHR